MSDHWHHLLATLRSVHAAVPAMADFCAWPEDAQFIEPETDTVAATQQLADYSGTGSNLTDPVLKAFQNIAPVASWRQSYSEAEMGPDFMQRYGFIEVVGPGGAFQTHSMQAYLGYWGPDLLYDWHHHTAEELYLVVAGQGFFQADGLADQILRPGEIRIHKSNQDHAMRTADEPVIIYALWRGQGVGEKPLAGRLQ